MVSLVLGLALAELAARWFLPRPGFEPFAAADYGVLAADPQRGYTYAPNLRRHIVTADYEIDFTTNEWGMRDGPLDGVPRPHRRVLAVGDSYTQGLGVQADQAWPKRFEALVAGSRVYNTGVSGYSIRQMRLAAEFFAPKIDPQLIIVGLYAFGYYRVENPFIIVPGGASPILQSVAHGVRVVKGGVLIPEFENPWLREFTFWLDEHCYLGAHVVHSAGHGWRIVRQRTTAPAPRSSPLPQAMSPMLSELLALQREADSWRVPLVVLLINAQLPDGRFAGEESTYNEIIRSFAQDHGICVVDPLPVFRARAQGRPLFRFRTDRHWSPAAHALAAEILVTSLKAADTSAPCRPAAAAVKPER